MLTLSAWSTQQKQTGNGNIPDAPEKFRENLTAQSFSDSQTPFSDDNSCICQKSGNLRSQHVDRTASLKICVSQLFQFQLWLLPTDAALG